MIYPIFFNGLKHHIGFIKAFVKKRDNPDLSEELVKIGGSQMDLYIGSLAVETIYDDVLAFLTQNTLLEIETFKNHLLEKGGYIECPISDNSMWTLRLGIEDSHYIHIHPSRYSIHTMRVKAGILKTAIAFLCLENADFTTENINAIRINIGLSPIKSVEDSENIKKMIEILRG